MRFFAIVLFCFAAQLSAAQNVAKERLAQLVNYRNDVRTDSIVYSSPVQFTINNKGSSLIQNWDNASASKLDTIYLYDSKNKLINVGYTKFDKTAKTSYHESYRFDSLNNIVELSSRDTTRYFKIPNLKSYCISYYKFDNSNELKISAESYYWYNENDLLAKDSIIYYDYNTGAFRGIYISEYNYNEVSEVIAKTILSKTDTTINNFRKQIEYFQNSRLVQSSERILINDNQDTTYHTMWYHELDQRNRITMEYSVNFLKAKADTTFFEEKKYIDSTNEQGQIMSEVIQSKTKQTDYINAQKTEYNYNEKGLLTNTNSYLWESPKWSKQSELILKYDNLDNLIEQENIVYVFELRSKRRMSYTKHGNYNYYITYKYDFDKNQYYIDAASYYYWVEIPNENIGFNFEELAPIAYPNPFNQSVNILFSCVPNKAGTITIRDLNGRLIEQHDFVSTNEIYQYEWRNDNLPSGIYMAQIVMGKEIASIKLIKQ